jgi:putative peptidoglycan lipid II flippase
MFNLTSILLGALFGYLIDPDFGTAAIVGWAIATLAGGFMQMAIQLPSLWREGYRYQAVLFHPGSGLGEVARRALPGIIAASAVEINVLVTTYFAANLERGSVAWLNYALRLAYLPIGLFGVGIGTTALPSLSRSASEKNTTEFRKQFNHALRLAMSFAIPSAIGIAIVSPLLISVLFERGRFTASDTLETARVVRYYAIGLVGYAALKVIVPAFYALGHAKKPMFVSFLAIAVNLFLCMFFTQVGPLDFGIFDLGARGLALATSCSAVLNSLILFLMLRAILERRIDFRRTLMGLGKVAFASAVMGGGVYLLDHLLRHVGLPEILWFNIARLAVLVGFGALIFLGAARFLNIQEAREITDVILRKLKINASSPEAPREDR